MTGDDRQRPEVSRASSHLAFIAFSAVTRCPSRIKSGTGFRRKTLLAPPFGSRSSRWLRDGRPIPVFLTGNLVPLCGAATRGAARGSKLPHQQRPACTNCVRLADAISVRREQCTARAVSLLRCEMLAAALDAFGARDGGDPRFERAEA